MATTPPTSSSRAERWEELAAQGRIVEHPVFPGRHGPAARRIEDDADVEDVIALMRINYEDALAAPGRERSERGGRGARSARSLRAPRPRGSAGPRPRGRPWRSRRRRAGGRRARRRRPRRGRRGRRRRPRRRGVVIAATRPRLDVAEARAAGDDEAEDRGDAAAHLVRGQHLHHRAAADGADRVGGAGEGEEDGGGPDVVDQPGGGDEDPPEATQTRTMRPR